MCGIFGLTSFSHTDLEPARKALSTLQHRGPDQWNDCIYDEVYLGHRRLSILDLTEDGKQPMVSPDGQVIITINGEIYNFLTLKQELKAHYSFKSKSDSEVILYGYIYWGIEKLLNKIDGMFAITIFDKTKNLIYLVRDRVGIKPMYYGLVGQQYCWSSELKPIESYYINNQLSVNKSALYDFLTYQYIPTPKTIYNEIKKLEPAHYVKIDLNNNQFKKIKYWELKVNYCNDDIKTAKQILLELLNTSVKEQMVADVPVGFFLSGGIDSSVVSCIASNFHSDINTFSIGFTDKSHDETQFSDIVANQIESKHTKKILNIPSIKDNFQKMKLWYDEPFGDTSCFPTYFVSEIAKQKVTVVLTGDGGDEVFGGYNWYRSFVQIQKKRKSPKSYLKLITAKLKRYNNKIGNLFKKIELFYALNDLEIYTKLMGGMIAEEKKIYKSKWDIPEDYDDYWYFRKHYITNLDLMTRLQYLDFHTYLHDDILTKVDRVSMAVSLECRVPLLATKLIEYAFSLQPDVRLVDNELKGLLKQCFKGILPNDILFREKKGFSIPPSTWQALNTTAHSRQERILKDAFNLLP